MSFAIPRSVAWIFLGLATICQAVAAVLLMLAARNFKRRAREFQQLAQRRRG